jgi:hypothetical protein
MNRSAVIEKLMAHREIKPNGCWEWTGPRNWQEYGQTNIGRKHWRVNRLSFTVFKSEIPKGMFVCHRCDNPPCFNPEHLFLGTGRDNANDCRDKDRLDRKRTILTRKRADEIREFLRGDNVTISDAMERFGVSRKIILGVNMRINWSDGKRKRRERTYHLFGSNRPIPKRKSEAAAA